MTAHICDHCRRVWYVSAGAATPWPVCPFCRRPHLAAGASGLAGGVSPESLALAEKAVAANKSRQDEDVKAWAERLAADVADAVD